MCNSSLTNLQENKQETVRRYGPFRQCLTNDRGLNELVGINNVLVGQDLDEIDQNKDITDAAEKGHDDLEDTLLVFTHDEIMDAETAKEEAEQSYDPFGLAGKLRTGLCTDINTAAEAYSSLGRKLLAAVLAESSSLT